MRTLPVLLAIMSTACGKEVPAAPATKEDAVKIAREAALEAFQQLSGELAKAIADGGPVAAIPLCSTKAGSLVAEVATRRKLPMIRLSDRPRNPQQVAKGADLAAIETFRAAMIRGETPAPATGDMKDGSTVVRLPITVSQPLCLQCHGGQSDIAPETRKAILEAYPDDKATGYQLNDLRGIWRITIPPQARP